MGDRFNNFSQIIFSILLSYYVHDFIRWGKISYLFYNRT